MLVGVNEVSGGHPSKGDGGQHPGLGSHGAVSHREKIWQRCQHRLCGVVFPQSRSEASGERA